MMHRPRLVTVAVAIALAVSGCSGTQAPNPGAQPNRATIDDLRAAGIKLVTTETDQVDLTGGGLLLTTVQAERLIAGQGDGAGVLGSDVDELAPVSQGAPPTSYLVAGWVSAGTSRAASVARAVMGEQDWYHAPDVLFPWVVLTLFVSDNTNTISAVPVPSTSAHGMPAPAAPPGAVGPAAATQPNPCALVTTFLATVIDSLAEALKLKTSQGTGFWETVGRLVAPWANKAIEYAKDAVKGLISALTAPIVEIIRTAIGALGVATALASYLTGQRLDVTLNPPVGPNQYRFAVGTEPDRRGEFVAKAPELTKSWPKMLVDCAAAVGAKIPEPIKPGAPATWTVTDNVGPVISADKIDPTVREDLTTRLGFVTGRESPEQAQRGQTLYHLARVKVEIPRQEVKDFLDFAERQARSVPDSVINKIPEPHLREFVRGKLYAMLDPALGRLRKEIEGKAGGVFSVSGTRMLYVLHHGPADEKPDPPTDPPVPSKPKPVNDFCARFADAVQWGATNAMKPSAQAWAAELARRFTEMQPLAPAQFAKDIAAYVHVYQLVADGANAGVIGGVAEQEDFPGAAQRLGAYCHIDTSTLGNG